MQSVIEKLKADPVVVAVASTLGLDMDDLPWDESDDAGEEVSIKATLRSPGMHLHSDGGVNIRWNRAGTLVRYEVDGDFRVLTIEDHTFPETVLTAMTGRTLGDIVDVPGARSMRIIEAVNSKAFTSDPLDVRIQVEPISTSPTGEVELASASGH